MEKKVGIPWVPFVLFFVIPWIIGCPVLVGALAKAVG